MDPACGTLRSAPAPSHPLLPASTTLSLAKRWRADQDQVRARATRDQAKASPLSLRALGLAVHRIGSCGPSAPPALRATTGSPPRCRLAVRSEPCHRLEGHQLRD